MEIQIINPYTKQKGILTPEGIKENDNLFPLINGAYRLVKDDNYTDNFGFQWNKFAATQVDKDTNLDISKKRFFTETGWDPGGLADKNVLEVGSGAGRFTQILLDWTEANVFSVDYSNAVEANYKNNGPNPRLHLFQASIYEMPFAPQQFDKVVCFGVLQHTPDVERSVKCLIEMVKPGGELVVDFYPLRGWWTKVQAKYMLRPFSKKMSHEKLFNKIDKNIDWLIKCSRFFSRIGLTKLNRFLPVCDIDGTLPPNIPSSVLRDLCVLDTFDMFSPQFDQPQKISNVVKWFERYGMENVWGGVVTYDNCKASVVKGIKK